MQVSGPLSLAVPTLCCLPPRIPPCQHIRSGKEATDYSKGTKQRRKKTQTFSFLITNTGSEPWPSLTRCVFSEDNYYTSQATQLHSIQTMPLLVICIFISQSKYSDAGRKISDSNQNTDFPKNLDYEELRQPPSPRELTLKYQYTCHCSAQIPGQLIGSLS